MEPLAEDEADDAIRRRDGLQRLFGGDAEATTNEMRSEAEDGRGQVDVRARMGRCSGGGGDRVESCWGRGAGWGSE